MESPENRLVAAVQNAITALNTTPRFKVPALATDSYKIVSELEKALAVYEYVRTQGAGHQ